MQLRCLLPLITVLVLVTTPVRADPPTTSETAKKTDAVFARLDSAMRKFPRQRFSDIAVIEQVGRDPLKLCAWVRAQTAFVPYAGVLRGPRGVMLDRVGNDLDRSLLLAHMVLLSGYDVRLARVELSETEAQQRLDSAAASKLPQINDAQAGTEWLALLDRAVKQSELIAQRVPPDSNETGWSKPMLAAVRDHWWIQCNTGRGWVDLDPTVAENAAPMHLGAGKLTSFPCSLPNVALNVPKELFHTVTASVVVERWQEGKIVEDTALSWGIQTWDEPETHIYLMHSFDTASKLAGVGDDAAKLKDLLLAAKTWRPVLMVGGRYRGPKTFDETGVLTEAPLGGAEAVGDRVRGNFGAGLSGASGGAKEKPNAALTAEWLDFTLAGPGTSPRTIRTEVFDSLGPAARAAAVKSSPGKPVWDDSTVVQRGLALAGNTDNLIASCRYPIEYFIHHRSDVLLQNRHAVSRTLLEPANPLGRDLLVRCLDPNWLGLLNCQRGLDPGGNVTFINEPNVCRLIRRRQMNPEGKIVTLAISDFAHNASIALLPSHGARVAACIQRGVADTICEETAVGRTKREPGDQAVRNTADVFDRTDAANWLILHDPADPALATLSLSPDARQRVTNDLAAHNIVVIPKQAADGRMGWWRIDSDTGRTIGVMDNGLCNDTNEYGKTHIPAQELEGTLPPRGNYVPMKGDVGRLAEQIIGFRNPQTAEEMINCWIEAFEHIYPGVNPY
jgi:hypothetical protein